MITPVQPDRFGLLIRGARERLGRLQEDVADHLGVDRSLVSQWERGDRKRPVSVDDVNGLAGFLGISVLALVTALGYDVRFEGIRDEADAVLLEAYQEASAEQRRVVRLALGLEQQQPMTQRGRSLRRLAATDRRDRRETQE